MNTELIAVRMKGFVYGLVSAIAAGIAAWMLDFFGSEIFRALVTEHFGETTVGVLILLVVDGVVKHVRNMRVVGAWKREFGSMPEHEAGKYKPDLV